MVIRFFLFLITFLLQSCVGQFQNNKQEFHEGVFTETTMSEKHYQKFHMFLKHRRESISDSIGIKDGLYLFDDSMCDVCDIQYTIFYFSENNKTIEYCYANNIEKKCSHFEGHSDVIKRLLNIDYDNYPLVVADWGTYKSDFQNRYIYSLKKEHGHETINLFYHLNRCFKIKCDTKVDYEPVPPKYENNVFIHNLVIYYLYPEIRYNEGNISKSQRDYFVNNFLIENHFSKFYNLN